MHPGVFILLPTEARVACEIHMSVSTCVFIILLMKTSRYGLRLSGDDCTHPSNKDIRLLGFMSYILGLLDTLLVYDHNCGISYAHYQCLLYVLDMDTDTGNICIHVVSKYI